jgi:hypothetical protein
MSRDTAKEPEMFEGNVEAMTDVRVNSSNLERMDPL